MKTFTINDIRNWNPCYDPTKYLPEGWEGNALDILNNDNIPVMYRLWVVLRSNLVSEKTMRLFAVWCYRQTLQWVKNQDPRSLKAAEVAEAYALGKATEKELEGARCAARDAAWDAAKDAARFAAMAAAWSAARFAARSSADYAALSAQYASGIAAGSVESAQKDKLIDLIMEENI